MRKKMIKGVSKQILEVTNTDNPYFEKIIFFVKPEHHHGRVRNNFCYFIISIGEKQYDSI